MEWNLLQLLFLLPLFCAGSSDDHECTPKTPNIGDTLELDCPCGEIDFKLDWFYKFDVNVEVALVSSGGLNERNYTFIVQNASLGGVYRCACTPAESCPEGECTECFNVSVKPTISSFTIQPPVARVGMPILLMCNATGHPDPVLQDFHLTKVNLPVILPALQKTGSGVTITINATLSHNGTFKCLVNLEGIGHDVADASATVYVPPAIVSIQNFTVFNYSVHHTATLECVVNNQSSTDYVRWIRNDTTLDQSGKYILSTGNEKGHTVATLSVRNLTRSDRGMYLCQAGSKYNTSESVVSVWILEDLTGPDITAEPPEDEVDSSGHEVEIGVGLGVAILVFAVVGVIAAIVNKKKGLPCQDSSDGVPSIDQPDFRYPPPINGCHNGAVTVDRDDIPQWNEDERKGITAESAFSLRKRIN